MRELVIIGAGPAGLSAAVYARRAGVDTVVFEGGMYGGQLVNTSEIKNYPSYKTVEGWELARNMFLQAEEYSTEFIYESVNEVEKNDGYFTVKTENTSVDCQAIIIATGSRRMRIACEGSMRYEGNGISFCASCDGQLYKGKTVAVVGGGAPAFEDGLYLSALAEKVYICAKEITADNEAVKEAKEKANIEIIEGVYPKKIYGENHVAGLVLDNGVDLPVSGIFTALGQTRDNAIFGSLVSLDKNGYVVAEEDCCAAEGIWVAGDTRTKFLRQIVTAASDGAVSATKAAAYIMKKRKK